MATTPPPPSSIQTPTTPRFGFHDNYEPYSPRKSTRKQQPASRSAQTPPPQSITPHHISPRSSRKRIAIDSSSDNNMSAPTSPQTAMKKKTPRASAMMGSRRVSGRLDFDSATTAADALGLPQRKQQHRSMAAVRNMGMLPTPDKTPKKAPTEIAPQIRSVARSLFTSSRGQSDEELMPSRKNKKKGGYTIDSFEDHMQVEGGDIAIFTDSNERVPEVDESSENPFFGNGARQKPESGKRASKRQKITIPGEGEVTLEEAEAREDGLVYVFRGKKMFRKFVDEDQVEEEEDALDRSVPSSLRGPRTRSSLKPRLLFAPPKKEPTTTDEEADTDIEDLPPTTPSRSKISTPKAPKFAPASPPTTIRATRSKNVEDMSPGDGFPTPRGRRGKNSPFDLWQRSRSESLGRKRAGGELEGGDEKRARL